MQNLLSTIDRFAIAARLRALLFARDADASPSAIAQTLDVRESQLRSSIDEQSPHPWVEVVLAVIRQYGVDPTWILTGVYDQATHRAALEDDANAEAYVSRTTLAREIKPRASTLDVVPHPARAETNHRLGAEREARNIDRKRRGS